jgi:ABC-2 type transport system permease protein
MLTDISIIVWKEWKELMRFQGSSRSGLMGLLIMIAIFGVFMPIQWGSMWVESAASLSLWLVIPLILAVTLVADSFAGERERHSLETLLASRISDQSILLGKIAAVVGYSWLATQLVFIVALIPINILHGKGKLLFYMPEVALSGLVLSFLLSSLMSNIGIMVSLRAATVKQAQQTLGLSVFIIAYLVPMLGVYGIKFLSEETRNKLFQPFLTGEIGSIVLAAAATLIILNAGFYAITKARFQRNRLIVDE